jgi:hypothetical protein
MSISTDSENLSGALEADRVYAFAEFADIAGISICTLRNLIKSGGGPTVTWMSARRGGIRGRATRTEAA